MQNNFAFIVTQQQATILQAALELLELESEIALDHGSFIDTNKAHVDNLLTVMSMAEEAKELREQLLLRFGIKGRKI